MSTVNPQAARPNFFTMKMVMELCDFSDGLRARLTVDDDECDRTLIDGVVRDAIHLRVIREHPRGFLPFDDEWNALHDAVLRRYERGYNKLKGRQRGRLKLQEEENVRRRRAVSPPYSRSERVSRVRAIVAAIEPGIDFEEPTHALPAEPIFVGAESPTSGAAERPDQHAPHFMDSRGTEDEPPVSPFDTPSVESACLDSEAISDATIGAEPATYEAPFEAIFDHLQTVMPDLTRDRIASMYADTLEQLLGDHEQGNWDDEETPADHVRARAVEPAVLADLEFQVVDPEPNLEVVESIEPTRVAEPFRLRASRTARGPAFSPGHKPNHARPRNLSPATRASPA